MEMGPLLLGVADVAVGPEPGLSPGLRPAECAPEPGLAPGLTTLNWVATEDEVTSAMHQLLGLLASDVF